MLKRAFHCCRYGYKSSFHTLLIKLHAGMQVNVNIGNGFAFFMYDDAGANLLPVGCHDFKGNAFLFFIVNDKVPSIIGIMRQFLDTRKFVLDCCKRRIDMNAIYSGKIGRRSADLLHGFLPHGVVFVRGVNFQRGGVVVFIPFAVPGKPGFAHGGIACIGLA